MISLLYLLLMIYATALDAACVPNTSLRRVVAHRLDQLFNTLQGRVIFRDKTTGVSLACPSTPSKELTVRSKLYWENIVKSIRHGAQLPFMTYEDTALLADNLMERVFAPGGRAEDALKFFIAAHSAPEQDGPLARFATQANDALITLKKSVTAWGTLKLLQHYAHSPAFQDRSRKEQDEVAQRIATLQAEYSKKLYRTSRRSPHWEPAFTTDHIGNFLHLQTTNVPFDTDTDEKRCFALPATYDHFCRVLKNSSYDQPVIATFSNLICVGLYADTLTSAPLKSNMLPEGHAEPLFKIDEDIVYYGKHRCIIDSAPEDMCYVIDLKTQSRDPIAILPGFSLRCLGIDGTALTRSPISDLYYVTRRNGEHRELNTRIPGAHLTDCAMNKPGTHIAALEWPDYTYKSYELNLYDLRTGQCSASLSAGSHKLNPADNNSYEITHTKIAVSADGNAIAMKSYRSFGPKEPRNGFYLSLWKGTKLFRTCKSRIPENINGANFFLSDNGEVMIDLPLSFSSNFWNAAPYCPSLPLWYFSRHGAQIIHLSSSDPKNFCCNVSVSPDGERLFRLDALGRDSYRFTTIDIPKALSRAKSQRSCITNLSLFTLSEGYDLRRMLKASTQDLVLSRRWEKRCKRLAQKQLLSAQELSRLRFVTQETLQNKPFDSQNQETPFETEKTS